jgi:hypothetical protein
MIVLLMGVTGSGKMRVELYALSNILGHKDLKLTQRYAKLSPEYIDSQRNRMDTIWTPAPIPYSEAPSQTPTKYVR